MSLHAYIPAGGEGTRLLPHTQIEPKPMLPMGQSDRRLIDFALDASSDCDTQVVSTNADARKAQPIERYLANKPATIVMRDRQPLGAAAMIDYIEFFEALDGDIAILPADHVHVGFSLQALYAHHLRMGRDVTLMTTPPKSYGDYTAVRDTNVHLAHEGDEEAQSITGIYVITASHLLGWMRRQRHISSEIAPRSMSRDIIFPAIHRGQAAAYAMPPDSYWDDAGTVARYYRNNMRYSHGHNVIVPSATVHPDAQIKASIVAGTATLNEEFIAHNRVISGNDRIINISEAYV